MDRMLGLENSFSGRNFSQGNRKEGAQDRESKGKQPSKHQGSPESGPPSEPTDERFDTCLWMTIDELMTRQVVTVKEK
jgi:hypothetical protein